jgi:hypothetical protein
MREYPIIVTRSARQRGEPSHGVGADGYSGSARTQDGGIASRLADDARSLAARRGTVRCQGLTRGHVMKTSLSMPPR